MSDMSFTWRGVSSDTHGVVVTRLPPVMIAGKRDNAIVVPGRSGALHEQDGAWDEIMLPIEFYLPYDQGGSVAALETLAAWLQGTDWLTLSNRPGKRFRARLTDPVTLSSFVEGFNDRISAINFWADPFAYEATPTIETKTSAFNLTRVGNIEAYPLITLTATGDITLTIGDKTLAITGVPGSCIIDVAGGLIYSGSTNLTGNADTDDWPLTIPPGTGTVPVSWTGTVTQMIIQPNWGWL
jgi:phage-related protein